MYLMQTYNDYCSENGLDLYGSTRVKLPKPELYVTFTKVANDQMNKYGKTRKAVEETIRICIDEDVLTEYLKEREVEVMDIMTALFDEEEVSRRYGLRMQREKAEDIARNMMELGTMSYEDISKCTGLTVAEVEKLANLELV